MKIQTPQKIENCQIKKLTCYENNARTHSKDQIGQIINSIKEFGFTNPILVDKNYEIIAGHGRYYAACELGMESVPVIMLSHLTDIQKKAYVIADNKLALNAGWNDELLAKELNALIGDDFDVSLLGFNDDELIELLGGGDQSDSPGADEDDAPDIELKTTTRLGDVWLMDNHRLICGDSTSHDVLSKLMADEMAECLWTDPPYNVAYEGAAGKIKNDDMGSKEFNGFLYSAFLNAFAFMKAGGAAYIAHADTEGLNFRSAFLNAGFKLSSCLIWKKNSLVLGRSDYQWQHEPILYGWKEGAAHRWYGERNKTTIIEFESELFSQIADNKWQIEIGDRVLIVSGEGMQIEDAHPTVIFEEKPKKNGVHPTMKPVALIERMLLNSTRTGDIVLDLFGGSGSTMIACQKLGRAARLVELDEKFADVIVRRWQEYTGKKAYNALTGKSFDEIENK